jgi:hypothetical protein
MTTNLDVQTGGVCAGFPVRSATSSWAWMGTGTARAAAGHANCTKIQPESAGLTRMTELENLRLALRNAQTMPLSYCEDGWEQSARDRREAIDYLQRRIAELESEQRGAFNAQDHA